jgi:LDH2 family malate/lactate/ureidoglycolate dehydrogenase
MAAVGKIRVARARGERLPEGWVIDSAGRPSTDPAAFDGDPPGALLPFGGPVAYKGFGLALVVEALAGALTPAGTSRAEGERGANGLFTMALDPAHFGEPGAFEQAFGGLIDWVKSPPLQPGVERVVIPGEPEQGVEAHRVADGIPIEDETWNAIAATARRLGVPPLEA